MKNKIKWLIFSLVIAFIFTINTNASVPNRLEAGRAVAITQYVSGYQAWYKTTRDQKHELYCEVANLKFPSNLTINLNSEVDKGFVYILNNKPNTGSRDKNYYIMQMSIWWYKDILTRSNDNLDQKFKTYCTNNRNSHDVCGRIFNLVEGARKYDEPRGSVSFGTGTVNFKEESGHYVSDVISYTSSNLTSVSNVKLVGAPSGATIVNAVNSTNKTGKFQVKVPVSSVREGQSVNFSAEIDGVYNSYSAFDYLYSSAYQKVLYDVVIPKSHTTSDKKSLRISKDPSVTNPGRPSVITENSLTIRKVDENNNYLRGATITLYEGNCLNSPCSRRDEFASWTTTRAPRVFENIKTGYYTVVETGTPEGYVTADKGLVYVRYDDVHYEYTMENLKVGEVKPIKISKIDITGANEIPGATLIIKDSNGKEVASWVSTNTAKQLRLDAGEYTLIEKYAPAGYKLTTTVVYFKVDETGQALMKNENGKYVPVDSVTITNEPNDIVSISKLDKSTNAHLSGAILVLKNDKGEIVATWTTTNEGYDIALAVGDYTLTEESAPNGYNLNNETIHLRVLQDGTLMVKNSEGVYEIVSGIIMYNEPILEEITITVPKTGLTSAITYTFGGISLLGGAYILLKNGQFSL